MAASHQTVEQIIAVVSRHVSETQLRAIIRDLEEVPGNRSFRETIQRIKNAEAVRDGAGRGGGGGRHMRHGGRASGTRAQDDR
jgi:hypothetical protein